MSLRWISLDELSQVVGAVEATALCRAYGGRNPYLPRRPRPGHPLERIIGRAALETLAAYAGGYHLDLPNLRRPNPAKEQIWDALDAGRSHEDIADEFKVGTRYVRLVAAQRRSVQRVGRLPICTPRQTE